ncbi:MAG: efflux RND transporter periplasmic adaptor subunit [Fimbriimonadaceae bacterium]|nr:efflux RND transporter periplasmic adaptor subunit [Chthonomonadaceae bacterium]MCO5297831.1 efflux RND transporter periplasmic adaptor subunit [Fimbriimonadaceae bacterium]
MPADSNPTPNAFDPPVRPAPNRWPLGVAVLAIVALAIWFFFFRKVETPDLKVYRVAEVGRGEVASTVVATGTLQPWTLVDIKSKAGGRVDEMAVEVGDVVKEGQILARIDPSDSQLAVDQAEAELRSARARRDQSSETQGLTAVQTSTAKTDAQARLNSARASLESAKARLRSAQDAAKAQPIQTESAIQAAEQSYRAALEARQQLDLQQANQRAETAAALKRAIESQSAAQAEFERQKELAASGYVAPRVVEQAKEALASADAQLAVARTASNTLPDTQRSARNVSDAQVAQAKAQLESAKAQRVQIQARKNDLEIAQSDLLSAQQSVRQAEVALKSAEAGLRNNTIRKLDITASDAAVFRAEASLANAQKTLDSTTLRAPSEGVVLQKYVEQGTIITSGQSLSSPGTSILQLGDVSRMYVNVLVDETDIGRIRVGQEAEIDVDAYPGAPYKGKVIRIEPRAQLDQNITTVAVRVEVENTGDDFRKLKPSMNATCTFVVEQAEDAIRIPPGAIQRDDQGSFVLVILDSKPSENPEMVQLLRSEKRRIKTGIEGDTFVEVTSGLKEGEKLAFDPVDLSEENSGMRGFGGGFGGRR